MDKAITLEKSDGATVSELAIFILSKKWPLRLQAIHAEITKTKPVSLQATHKSLKRLVEQNILAKKERRYSLNKQWLQSIGNFSEQTKKAYEQASNTKNKENQKVMY